MLKDEISINKTCDSAVKSFAMLDFTATEIVFRIRPPDESFRQPVLEDLQHLRNAANSADTGVADELLEDFKGLPVEICLSCLFCGLAIAAEWTQRILLFEKFAEDSFTFTAGVTGEIDAVSNRLFQIPNCLHHKDSAFVITVGVRLEAETPPRPPKQHDVENRNISISLSRGEVTNLAAAIGV